jgi:excinuclease UvrABC ATPase subunit
VWKSITGAEAIRSVLALEPRTPSAQKRSSVATLLGLAENLRRIFGKSVEARKAGLTATDFGLNAGRGRCQTCLGLGEVQDDDRYVPCPHCGGRRFGEEALAVRVEGLNVAEVLELPITELAYHPFAGLYEWLPLIYQLVALDLGYVTLGRRVDRLSGGEHQRLRIARTLRGDPEGLLLVLDEPSAGLHPQDVARLLRVLDRVVSGGRNTIVLVEHNLDLIRVSDWVIDFGPGGGPAGGRIVGQGSPQEIAKRNTPTGRALRSKKFRLASHSSKARRLDSKRSSVKSEEAARNGRQWLKRLLGEEASAEELDPVDFEGLAVTFDSGEAALRPHEIAGLDVEIARLLLDEPDDVSQQPERLALLWSETPNAQLRIHPLIEELRVWGGKLPLSVLRAAQKRLKHMGLESDLDIKKQSGLGDVRVTGKRFNPAEATLAERVRCIRDAMGIGGGYVELWNSNRVLGTIKKRHLALEIPAVAPLSPTSASLVRSHSAGRCPCCEGQGSVPIFDQELVIANQSADATSESFLHPEAFKVLRGVRRSILIPFLKRMVTEGLWPPRSAFAHLKPDERTILLHGYWRRPGPGSFLKSPKADPEEVSSWLRWNGLFRAVLEEVDRSKSSDWKKEVRATTSRIECPDCEGTGLQRQSRAIQVGSQSLFDWIRTGTIGGLRQALKKLSPASSRSHRTCDRIVYCLEPLSDAVPRAALREPIEDAKLIRAVFERSVRSLTQLRVIG